MSRYARLEVTLIALVGLAATGLVAWLWGWWALVPAIAAAALLAFYRDPPRRCPADGDVILAPADGRVVEVSRDIPGSDGERVLRIMIFLSVLNVHINRFPCTGRVTEVSYRPGKFHSALGSAADKHNESNTVVIAPREPLPGPVRVRQIAGVLARRIVCTVRTGDELAAGTRFGMIKLGSRTEVTVPESAEWDVRVAVGDRVKAGRDVLARLAAGHPAVMAAGDGPDWTVGRSSPEP
jgi:phosphatidylserine decarboxylase